MQIAVLTFDGFNEIDSFVASAILNRMRDRGWNAYITCPGNAVTSMNGVTVEAQRPLEFASEADAVVIGSGIRTREIAQDEELLSLIKLDPSWQLIGAQCSGTLLLARLGLLNGLPACTDISTKPWVLEAGVNVIDAPFVANGNVATAGGCLASHYLATWLIARGASLEEAGRVLRYVAPVGQTEQYVGRAVATVAPFLVPEASSSRDACIQPAV